MDDELVGIAKTAIGAEFGLTPEQAARLHGSSASELRADAKTMRRELGMPDLDERERDEQGRFRPKASGASESMNAALRAARGTPDDKADPTRMNQLIRAATGRG